MINLKYGSLVLWLICISWPCFAFNEKKCQDYIHEHSRSMYGPIDGGLSATSQFYSDWGECAKSGKLHERRELYFTFHYELTIDAAKGDGEYIEALAQLSGCRDQKSINQFMRNAKTHFKEIFAEEIDPEEGLKSLDRINDADPRLVQTCLRVNML